MAFHQIPVDVEAEAGPVGQVQPSVAQLRAFGEKLRPQRVAVLVDEHFHAIAIGGRSGEMPVDMGIVVRGHQHAMGLRVGGDPQPFRDAPRACRVELHVAHAAQVDQVAAGPAVHLRLATGQRHAGMLRQAAQRAHRVVPVQGFFEPMDAVGLERADGRDRLRQVVRAVGVDHQHGVRADGFPYRTHARHVHVQGHAAYLHLDAVEALRHVSRHLGRDIQDVRAILVIAAGDVRAHAGALAAQQPPYGQSGRLALDVP
ncbi:hypothetical protein CEY05_22555 [Achromobacter sp. HZ34]|nr:hypothetical protein CEY05_22555 [Achromobacter sp. HZ34]